MNPNPTSVQNPYTTVLVQADCCLACFVDDISFEPLERLGCGSIPPNMYDISVIDRTSTSVSNLAHLEREALEGATGGC